MPVIIDQNNNASVVDAKGNAASAAMLSQASFVPKFFHKSVLTGRGGQSKGLLSENRDPKMYPNGYPTILDPNMEYGTHYNKDIKIYNIPCFILVPSIWDAINTFDRPNPAEMTKIATKNDEEIWLWMPLHAVQVEESETPGPAGSSKKTKEKKLSASFHMFLFSIKDHAVTEHTSVRTVQRLCASGNKFYRDIVSNMFHALHTVENQLTKLGYFTDKNAMNDFVQQYSLYTELCRAAERWNTKIDYYIADVMVKNLNTRTGGKPDYIWTNDKFSAYDVLGRLEKYSVPLEQYHTMYHKMAAILNPDILTSICRANLNLKLSNTLNHMNQNRASLQFCPCNNHIQTKIPYSTEQRNALESTSPLTLVQSGAGTGKSTVILGRINHMVHNGIDPKDIMVLSFTNAAANHIKDLNPRVNSMTIAAMLHTIYSHNHPTHQLSMIKTIVNSLDIFFAKPVQSTPQNQQFEKFLYEFKYKLKRLEEKNEFTPCLNFVEDHLQEVITVLDTIEQTSLELENIICYLCMDTLVEPPETTTKHLIIDEVQDNSVAEFVYSIAYTDKHKCSMYIVGDCSQTLYEFRASNPKALNVLENSGVFETYKLQTNYRSNQEILDFANILLGTIEANQYANIQLKANSLKPVTLASFKEAVTVHYEQMMNKSPYVKENMWAHSVAVDTRKYVADKLAKNEQVAFLAPTRNICSIVEEQLRHLYPGKKIVSLVPDRNKESEIISKFIARFWDTIQYVPPGDLLGTIRRELTRTASWLSYASSPNAIQAVQEKARKLMDAFEQKHKNTIQNWQNQVIMSVMTIAEMMHEVRKLLISFEIQRNAMAQAVMSVKNADKRQTDDVDNADFVISTIHSAKGLEFDNTVVYYENASDMQEPDKRKYYVAFTRAKKSEYIFAYDTLVKPKIVGDYARIIKDLEAKEKAVAKAAGVGTDADSDDDKDDAAAEAMECGNPDYDEEDEVEEE